MKTLILVFLLAGCGQDESAEAPKPTTSPSPKISVPDVTDHGEKTAEQTKTLDTNVGQSADTPTPTPASPFQSHALIVQQAFETDEWAFDITQGYLLYNNHPDNLKFMKSQAVISRKVAGVSYTCVFRMKVFYPENAPSDSWATIMLEAGPSVGINTSNQPPQCQASSLHYIYFKVSNQCQGYNQQTYICGQGNITYDLVEQ